MAEPEPFAVIHSRVLCQTTRGLVLMTGRHKFALSGASTARITVIRLFLGALTPKVSRTTASL